MLVKFFNCKHEDVEFQIGRWISETEEDGSITINSVTQSESDGLVSVLIFFSFNED